MNNIGNDDEKQSKLDYWMGECAFIPGHGCMHAGSEECEWECPFHDDYELFMRISNHPDNDKRNQNKS